MIWDIWGNCGQIAHMENTWLLWRQVVRWPQLVCDVGSKYEKLKILTEMLEDGHIFQGLIKALFLGNNAKKHKRVNLLMPQ